MISGAKFGGYKFGQPKLGANAFSSPIDCPSLHILGNFNNLQHLFRLPLFNLSLLLLLFLLLLFITIEHKKSQVNEMQLALWLLLLFSEQIGMLCFWSLHSYAPFDGAVEIFFFFF